MNKPKSKPLPDARIKGKTKAKPTPVEVQSPANVGPLDGEFVLIGGEKVLYN